MRKEYSLLIHDNALAILNCHEMKEVFNQTVMKSGMLFKAQHVFLYTVETTEELELQAGIGEFTSFIGNRLKFGQGLPGRVWETGQPLYGDGYADENMSRLLKNAKAVIAVPLKANEHVIGVLGIALRERQSEVDEEKVFWLNKFAELVSVAIDHARLYAATMEVTDEITVWVEEKKAFEKMLQDKNAEIQKALEQLKETQAQLIQQEKMAGIGYLAAGVAHEINNPLGFILSNFDTLQKYITVIEEMVQSLRTLHEKVRAAQIPSLLQEAEQISGLIRQKKLDYIVGDIETLFAETNEGLSRVSNIVKALRMFSRADRENSFTEYDLNAGVKNALLFARSELKYAGEVIERLAEVPHVQALGGQVNQVLLNLILNAAHAVKDRGDEHQGIITISTYADEQFVYCSVEDNGAGIPEEVKKNIFTPFFTTKPVGQGTGLGLSISYDIIVNKHHGELLFTSQAGVGSNFTVKLPLN